MKKALGAVVVMVVTVLVVACGGGGNAGGGSRTDVHINREQNLGHPRLITCNSARPIRAKRLDPSRPLAPFICIASCIRE